VREDVGEASNDDSDGAVAVEPMSPDVVDPTSNEPAWKVSVVKTAIELG